MCGSTENEVHRLTAAWVLLGAWGIVVCFWGLGATELHHTEGLRARVGAEMLRGHNWTVPTLYGEPLLTKPPLMYAAIALASWPLGEVTTRTARLPSALAGMLVLILFGQTFARCLGQRAGLLAAAILPACLLWLDRVPSAEIDLVQLGWVSASLLAFLKALEAAEDSYAAGSWRAWCWWQVALGCVAGGVLTKWTAPAFFYLSVIPLLWWRGRLGLLLGWPHLTAAALAAAVCAAWALAVVCRAGWDDLRDTVLREALMRLSPAHHPRPYPWAEVLTFPLSFLAAALPWSVLALLTLRPSFARLWDERGRRLLQLLHCWAWSSVLFWALVPGHKARHLLPAQPALAGLAAFVWAAWLEGQLRWPLPRLRPAVVLTILLVAWLGVKAAYVHAWLPAHDPGRRPRLTAQQIASRVPAAQKLYLLGLKDEGILFYYGRAAQRVHAAQTGAVPSGYYLLTQLEWRHWTGPSRPRVLLWLQDEQGAPIALACVS